MGTNIVIIDDEQIFRDMAKHLIQKTTEGLDNINVFQYQNAESFLEQLNGEKQNIRYNILFCDIDLPGMNGIELGTELKKRHPEIFLVYLTSYAEYAVESYTIQAYQYILKQDMESRLPSILNQLLKEVKRSAGEYRIIQTSMGARKLYYEDILYAYKEKGSKNMYYVTTWGECRERITMDRLMEEINSDEFVLVSRGFVVNLRHISGIEGNTIVLNGQEQITVSRARVAKVKEQIHLHWRSRL